MTSAEEALSIEPALQQRLRRALVDERLLLEAVRRCQPAAGAESAGIRTCSCALALPRPLDPETAEVRQLAVSLRATDGGWEIFAVEGIELDLDA